MPQPRKYANDAEKQAAYRARLASQSAAASSPRAPGYTAWRRDLTATVALVDAMREEMQDWVGDRSEAWQGSDRAGEFDADIDQLEEISDLLAGLNVWRKG